MTKAAKKTVKTVTKKATKPVAKVTAKTVKAAKAVKKAAPAQKKTTAKVVKKATSVKKTVKQAVSTAKKKGIAKAPAKKAVKAPAKAAVAAKKVVKAKTPVKTVKKTAPVKVAAKTAKPVAKIAVKAAAPVAAAPVAKQPAVVVRPAARPNTIPQVARATTAAKPAMAPLPANDLAFKAGDYVVYPTHGVGTVSAIETQHIAGMTVQLYTINFERDRMRLKIPVQKAAASGLRKLATNDRLKDALKTLTGRSKVKRTMWSRRAQEYEAKINSGDPVQIAEVLRDLRRPKDDTEQSYSERQIFQNALERLAREVAAVEKVAEAKAIEKLSGILHNAA